MVDVLRAVIGMEAMNGEGEIGDGRFEDRKHVVLGDSAYGAHGRELGDLVDQVDVVEPLHAIEVALMQRIDAADSQRPSAWGLHLSPMAIRTGVSYPTCAWKYDLSFKLICHWKRLQLIKERYRYNLLPLCWRQM